MATSRLPGLTANGRGPTYPWSERAVEPRPGGSIDLHGRHVAGRGVVLGGAVGGCRSDQDPAFEVRAGKVVLAHLDIRPAAQVHPLLTLRCTGIADEGDRPDTGGSVPIASLVAGGE